MSEQRGGGTAAAAGGDGGGKISFAPVTTDRKNTKGGGRKKGEERKARRICAKFRYEWIWGVRREEEQDGIRGRNCGSLVWISFAPGSGD